MQPGAALQAMLLAALLAGPRGATGRLLSASDLDLRGGQLVCRGGTQKPCYKVIYFHDASRRLNFEEAKAACRRDGGQLVSIESEDEQRLIEKFIENLLASDGDFWIGLRRREEKQSNGTACQDLYAWTDGSTSTFRNWYVDEPSCGSEVCVVMYHQPSAPAGIGGRYMFQWNDDQCNMKNNFICKYSDEKPTAPSTKPGGERTEPATPMLPEDTRKEDARETFKGNKVFMFCVTEVTPCVSRIREPHCGRQMKSDIVILQFSSGISHTKLGQSPHVKGTVYSKSLQTSVTSSGVPRPPLLLATNPEDAHNPLRFDSSLEQLTEFRKIPYVGLHFIVKDTDHHQPAEETEAALNLAYILIPSIVLLLVVITVVCWVWIYRRRKGEQPGPSTKEQHTIWPSPHAGNSPDLEVYNIIRKQSEADLAETRPDLKNISFRVCSGEATLDDLSCDYDNMAVNPSESGFVTLASVESGFVTNDIYEFSSDRTGRSKESGWVENEIYGY